jgi:geranylgeranyl pyrophosphate synthase
MFKECEVGIPSQEAPAVSATGGRRIEIVKQQVNDKLRAFTEDSKNHPALQEYLQTAHDILLSSDAKRTRSFLPVLIADANGFDRETCFKYGITIELLHYSSLIHDDVIDADQYRRGCPTLNSSFTNAHAVLIGDFMMCSVIDFALDFNHSNEVIKLMVGAIKKLVTGLVIEQKVMPKEPTLQRYLEMADLKTGALFQLSIGLPFVAHEHLPEAMACGGLFGLLFQIYDDFMDQNKDGQYHNIFHILPVRDIIDVWNENYLIFMNLARKLNIDQVFMEMISHLKNLGYFLETVTPDGILFVT